MLVIILTEYFKVIEAYNDYEFDANHDFPGNKCWEELYQASSKGTKVILTVGDSDEVWQKSIKNFWIQETRRDLDFHLEYL